MKLLLVTNLFPIPDDPERGIFTLQLVKRLRKKCDVTVVCPLPWFPNWKLLRGIQNYRQFATTPRKYVIDGVEVHAPKYLMIPKLSENFHAYLMALGIRSTIEKLEREIGFDAVNSQWLYPDSVATDDIVSKLGIPHIATGLGCDINQDLLIPVKGPMILKTLQRCDAVTVVSNSHKEILANNGISAEKVSVILNGIDTNSFKVRDRQACRTRLAIAPEAPMLLYMGRLSEEKDPATVLHALHGLRLKNVRVSMFFVGDGPLQTMLEDLTRSLELEDSVRFVGRVAYSDVTTWMGATDFLCLPSLREGCPNVILEALGSGRPIIASRVGAIPDVVTKQSGILFTPGNADELGNSIEQAIDTTWSESDINHSIEKLTWDSSAETYCDVFQNAIVKAQSSHPAGRV